MTQKASNTYRKKLTTVKSLEDPMQRLKSQNE
jgi:hypothetical protein